MTAGLTNGVTSYFVVRAVDAQGNASAPSNEVSGVPHPAIGWANLQWPPTLTHTISRGQPDRQRLRTGLDRRRHQASRAPTPGLRAQLGFGPDGSNPAEQRRWTWVDAAFNADAGNNDEFMASPAAGVDRGRSTTSTATP